MTATATAAPLRVRRGYAGLLELANALDFELAPFQRKVLRAAFGRERELGVVLPRGHGKSTMAALLALHTIALTPGATVAVGSTGRAQATIVRELLERFADHPALGGRLELRAVQGDRPAARWEGGGTLTVISGRGSRAAGRTDELALVDEAWALGNATRQGDDLLGMLQTGMAKAKDGKVPTGRLVVISTSAPDLAGPLGRMRARAMAGTVKRRGGHVDAVVPGVMRWLEWSIAPDRDLDDLDAVLAASPAPWVTRAVLREAKARCSPLDFAQHHAGKWGVGSASWLPEGSWTACCDPELVVPDGTDVWCGLDVGGTSATTAIVAVTADLRVAHVDVRTGADAVLDLVAAIPDLGRRFRIREIAYDPWRAATEMMRLEREHGVQVVEFPQSSSRMSPASEALYRAVQEGRLRHDGHAELSAHVAAAVAKATPRGWRLERGAPEHPIDSCIALAMAVSRCDVPPPAPPRFFWI